MTFEIIFIIFFNQLTLLQMKGLSASDISILDN